VSKPSKIAGSGCSFDSIKGGGVQVAIAFSGLLELLSK
jgi:hypothetical protein